MAQCLGNWYWQWRISGTMMVGEKLKTCPIFHTFWDCGGGRSKIIECNRKEGRTCATHGSVKAGQGRDKRAEVSWGCALGKGDNSIFKWAWGAWRSCCSRNGSGEWHLLWFVPGKSQVCSSRNTWIIFQVVLVFSLIALSAMMASGKVHRV